MRGWRLRIALALLILAAAALAGCSGGATKAGGSGGPVTLRIGTADTPGRPGSDQIEEFARRVEQLSGGKIRIEPVWEAAGPDAEDWDQQVARLVVAGELDLGMIPARAWDTEGVASLRALHAPFLVSSDELLDRIVTSELATEMLAGLEEVGVVGLALLPETVRHPFGFGAPLLSAKDYEGKTIRTPHSDVSEALFQALGASPVDLNGNAFRDAIADGTVAAAETAFVLADNDGPPTTMIATGNVAFFAKANALVIDQDVLAEMADEQRRILDEAAAGTLLWAIESTPTDVEAAKDFCDKGGSIVLASDADLATLEQAAAPVYAELEDDPQTRSLIERIRELKSDVAASASAIPAACGQTGAPEGSDAATVAPNDPSVLNGVYRNELSYEYLIKSGLDEEVARHDSGVWTTTLEAGGWIFRLQNPEVSEEMVGTYTVDGDRVTFSCSVGCDWTVTMVYELTDEGLSFRDVRILPPYDSPYYQQIARVEWAPPLKRIG